MGGSSSACNCPTPRRSVARRQCSPTSSEITRKTKGVAHTISDRWDVVRAASKRVELRVAVRHARSVFDQRRTPDLKDEAILNTLHRAAWRQEILEAGKCSRSRLAAGARPERRRRVRRSWSKTKPASAWKRCSKRPTSSSASCRNSRASPACRLQFRSRTPQLLHGYRPHESAVARRVVRRCVSDVADLSRLAVREQFQQVRPGNWQFTVQADSRFRTDTAGDQLVLEVRNQQGRHGPAADFRSSRSAKRPVRSS